MSFTLTDEDMAMGSEFPDSNINDMILGYFEGPLDYPLTKQFEGEAPESQAEYNSVEILDDVYAAGLQRLPADEYLLDLSLEKLEKGDYTFSNGDIIELRKQNPIIQAAAYSQEVKDAIAKLLTKLNEKSFISNSMKNKRRNQLVRKMYEDATNMNAAPGRGPANRIRNFVGVKVPRGAEGGSRKKSSKSKKTRKVKKTLRKRN